jgi:hypothetical protein
MIYGICGPTEFFIESKYDSHVIAFRWSRYMAGFAGIDLTDAVEEICRRAKR